MDVVSLTDVRSGDHLNSGTLRTGTDSSCLLSENEAPPISCHGYPPTRHALSRGLHV